MLATRPFRPAKLLLFCLLIPATLYAQNTHSQASGNQKYDIFGGYSLLSNSFNGHSSATSHVPLNGWDAAFSAPIRNALRFKADVSGYYGTSLGDPQRPVFILGGAQYSKHFGKETGFLEGLLGVGAINSSFWGGQGSVSRATFAAVVGGGLDTPISQTLAFRVQGDLLHANFTISDSNEIHGLPNYFGRFSAGLVWKF
jgi:hypothetical protein